MHGVLVGHSSSLKFWIPPKAINFLSSPFLNQLKFPGHHLKGGGGGGATYTMKCMYFIQLTTSTDFITISLRFFQQVKFNNSNPFSVLWSLWAQTEPSEYILIQYWIYKSHFWLNYRLISIKKKKFCFQWSIWPCIFWHQSGHKYGEPEILNTLRQVYF